MVKLALIQMAMGKNRSQNDQNALRIVEEAAKMELKLYYLSYSLDYTFLKSKKKSTSKMLLSGQKWPLLDDFVALAKRYQIVIPISF